MTTDPHAPMSAGPEPHAPTESWEDKLLTSGEALAERPEVLAGAAFAGGALFALILKRFAR